MNPAELAWSLGDLFFPWNEVWKALGVTCFPGAALLHVSCEIPANELHCRNKE